MLQREAIRAYVGRDWRRAAAESRRWWRERSPSITEAFSIAEELRLQAAAVRPDWPTPADRAADLAVHVGVHEMLSLVRSTPEL